MTITLPWRKVATAIAVAALVFAGLFAWSGGHQKASAATTATGGSVQCVGAVSGPIPSAATKINGFTGLKLVSASHGITIPTDAASGLPSGKRQHKPYTFTLSSQAVGDANIVLTNVLVNNENLKSCTFRYFHSDANGKVVPYLTVGLTNAHLVSYSFSSGGTVTWSATYEKIKWAGAANKTAEDDWEVPAG